MDIRHLSDQGILENLGQRFKTARLNKNISIANLATKTGITGRTISNLEKGKKSVGLLNIIAILRGLELLDELHGFIPQPPPRAAAVVKREKTLGRVRQRASSKRHPESAPSGNTPWQWAED